MLRQKPLVKTREDGLSSFFLFPIIWVMKKVRDWQYLCFLGIAILTLVFGALFCLSSIPEVLNPSFSWPSLCFGGAFILLGGYLLLVCLHHKKGDPWRFTRIVGILSSILILALLVLCIMGSLMGYSQEYRLNFYLFVGVFVAFVVASHIIEAHFGTQLKNGKEELAPARLALRIANLTFLAVAITLATAPIKTYLALNFKSDPQGVAWMVIAFIIINFLTFFFVSMFQTYFVITCFTSAANKRIFGLKDNTHKVIEIVSRYDLNLFIGSFFTLLMAIGAVISGIRDTPTYFVIAIGYFGFLAVRIPIYFWDRKIQDNCFNQPYRAFKTTHKILIYTGAMLILFSLGSIILNSVPGLRRDPKGTSSSYFTFTVFAVWTLFRIILSINSLIREHRTKDPYDIAQTHIGIYLTMHTLGNVIHIGLNLFASENQTGLIILAIVSFAMLGLTIYQVFKVFIIGARGLLDKRYKAYLKVHPDQEID